MSMSWLGVKCEDSCYPIHLTDSSESHDFHRQSKTAVSLKLALHSLLVLSRSVITLLLYARCHAAQRFTHSLTRTDFRRHDTRASHELTKAAGLVIHVLYMQLISDGSGCLIVPMESV